jgi:hypothetical protein
MNIRETLAQLSLSVALALALPQLKKLLEVA